MQTPEEILKRYFGHSHFRGSQKKLVDALLEGHDVLGVMPTGAGKSVCYQVPALCITGLTLVISPLISLMKDQVRALSQAGIAAAYLSSTLSAEEQRRVLAKAHAGELRLLYTAPERLASPGFAALFAHVPPAFVAVDEAHCISQWGQDFRPSYGKIADFLRGLPERPPVGAFTATATKEVRADIVHLLGLHNPLVAVSGFDRPNLTLVTEQPHDKREHLITLLREHAGRSGIVYCSTRKAVDDIYAHITARGFSAGRYHAGLSADQRRERQDDFLADRTTVMVATNAFGMGIDKPNVSFVIHYNMPQSLESYYQEAGRAGRVGAPADCILLYSARDVRTCAFLLEQGSGDEELDAETRQIRLNRDRERLRQMTLFSTTTHCLRHFLLSYFGENPPASCASCANCLAGFAPADATTEAQKIVSCVYRLTQRGFAADKTLICAILHGKADARIRRHGLDTLSTYGIMQETPMSRMKRILDQLIAQGYLALTEGTHPAVRLSVKSDDIIRKHLPFHTRSARIMPAGSAKALQASPLYEALRALRAEFAVAENLSAEAILPGAALLKLCARQPVTPGAFLETAGIGQARTDKYGAAFLRLIRRHVQHTADNLPPGAASAQRISGRDHIPHRPWSPDDDKALQQAASGLTLPQLSAELGRPLGAVLARLKLLGLPIRR